MKESVFSQLRVQTPLGTGQVGSGGRANRLGCFDSLSRTSHAHTPFSRWVAEVQCLTVCANITAHWDYKGYQGEGRVAVSSLSRRGGGGGEGSSDVQINACVGQAGAKWPSVYTCDGEASLACGC